MSDATSGSELDIRIYSLDMAGMIAKPLLAGCALLASASAWAQPAPPPPAEDKGWTDAELQTWAEACPDPVPGSPQGSNWDTPAPPARVYGNAYYVGTCGIGTVLITGDEGHVLIDGGTEAGAKVIAANIESLGFALEDVKLILMSHEHLDHVGGVAELQQRTGAKLLVSAEARSAMESGKASEEDPQAAWLPPFTPPRVDGEVKHGEPVTLGNVTLLPIATPGHTPGALSWQWRSCSAQICATMVYVDSLGPASAPGYRFSDHPDYVTRFRTSLDRVADLGCTILLSPHPEPSAMRRRFSFGSPFGEPSCRAYAKMRSEQLDARLAAEAEQEEAE